MKFDLIEINKLSPPGLWDLGVLTAVIAMMRSVIAKSVIAGGTSGAALIYGQMVVRYCASLRDKTRDNLNMRIKAWVLQCPIRIAQVRQSIGEMAIKRWRTNRLADYALTRYFGDWRRKWPDGFKNGFANNDTKQRRQSVPKFTSQPRAYKWKLFALVKIVNVHRLLYHKLVPSAQDDEMRDAYYKLWGVDITEYKSLTKWTQPRGARSLKPISFTPNELELGELEDEAEAEAAQPITLTQDAPKRIEAEVQSGSETDGLPSDKKPP